jgi:hypothetical protein
MFLTSWNDDIFLFFVICIYQKPSISVRKSMVSEGSAVHSVFWKTINFRVFSR